MDSAIHANAIYAITDNIANTIHGGLITQKHDAAAIRFFGDVANDHQTLLYRHPQDFDLVRLGYITHNNQLEPAYEIIITGKAWRASQKPEEPDGQ